MDKKKSDVDRAKAYMKMAVGLMVSFSLIFLAFWSAIPGESLQLGIVIAIALVFAIFFVYQGYKDLRVVKAGMPIEDERSKRIMLLTSSKAYYISLYWILAVMIFSEDLGIKTADDALALGIAGMAVAFFVGWLYASRFANLDQ